MRHANNLQKQIVADEAETDRLQGNCSDYLSAALDGLIGCFSGQKRGFLKNRPAPSKDWACRA